MRSTVKGKYDQVREVVLQKVSLYFYYSSARQIFRLEFYTNNPTPEFTTVTGDILFFHASQY